MSDQAAKSAPPAEPPTWYVLQQGVRYGPFTREQIVAGILQKRLARDAQLMLDGWKDWRPILQCLDYLSESEASRKARETKASERRVAAPRVPFAGSVQAKTGTVVTTGEAKDISVSGIFVATAQPLFKLGEHVELHIVTEQLRSPISARAQVMRFNANQNFSVGYGLRFVAIDNRIIGDIAGLVGVRAIQDFGIEFPNPADDKERPATAAATDEAKKAPKDGK